MTSKTYQPNCVLTGPVELALVGGEDGLVERRLLLALGDGEQLAALVLGGLVDRVLLGDRLPGLTAVERLLGGLGLGLLLGQDDAQVAALGLGEALLVLLVVGLDLGVGDLVLALGDLLAQLVGELLEAHAEEHVLLGEAGGLEELLVVLLLRERLLLLLLELLLDLGLGDLDVLLLGLAGHPLVLDEQLHDLVAQALVLLLALGLEVRVLRLGLALGRLGRGLLLVRDALRVLRRVGDLRLRSGLAALRRTLRRRSRRRVIQWSKLFLVIELVLDLGHGVAGDVVTAARGEDERREDQGARGQRDGVLRRGA